MRNVGVFCGSSHGAQPDSTEEARELGRLCAERKRRVVYGGGGIGLMGEVADAALAAGGEVIGVVPRGLAVKEVAHEGLTELHVVETMLERKALMAELADGFVSLPGGFGTADELFEMVTWTQLGIHAKPNVLLDVAGYWSHLRAWLDHAQNERFLKPENRELVMVAEDPVAALDALEGWQAPPIRKWI